MKDKECTTPFLFRVGASERADRIGTVGPGPDYVGALTTMPMRQPVLAPAIGSSISSQPAYLESTTRPCANGEVLQIPCSRA
jgi:hypothetical protein